MSQLMRTPLLLLLIGMVGACETEQAANDAPPENDVAAARDTGVDRDRQDRDRAPGSNHVRQDIAAFERNLEADLRDTRRELDDAGTRIAGWSAERWEELSADADDRMVKIRSEVRRINSEENGEELARVREDAAHELADLQGELAREELAAAESTQDFRERADARLAILEEDLSDVLRAMNEPYRDDRRDDRRDADEERRDVRDRDVQEPERPAMQDPQRRDVQERDRRDAQDRDPRPQEALIGADELQRLVEKLAELRAEVEALDERDERFAERREELAEEIGELTRDIRKHWYQMRWQRPGY